MFQSPHIEASVRVGDDLEHLLLAQASNWLNGFPKVFKMKKGQTGPLTMEKMKAGEQCGACHNGKTVVAGKTPFTVDDQANCEKCHKK